MVTIIYIAAAWSWSYGSWIYNYLCNQYLIITTNVSSNTIHGEVNSIQQYMYMYVIKFVSDLQQVGGFLRVLRFPPPLKLIAMI